MLHCCFLIKHKTEVLVASCFERREKMKKRLMSAGYGDGTYDWRGGSSRRGINRVQKRA